MKLLQYILGWPLLLILWVYRNLISPLTAPACRYNPTCSAYAKEAVKLHGPFKGFALTVKRVTSCHPWGGHGWDPVPGSELEQQLKNKDL
ncbi:MAG: membrane protein insertion efficiency factor YidD [Schleiferiaceae bacterium]